MKVHFIANLKGKSFMMKGTKQGKTKGMKNVINSAKQAELKKRKETSFMEKIKMS